MELFKTHDDRWVARDTPAAPARAIVTRIWNDSVPSYRAKEFHVLPDAGAAIGDYASLEDALTAIRSHIGTQFRTAKH